MYLQSIEGDAQVPTIANMPAADIEVEFPDGITRTVNMIVLLAQTQNAEMFVRYGHHLARNHPTLRQLRDQYGIPPYVNTWARMAFVLRDFHTILSEHIADTRPAAYGGTR